AALAALRALTTPPRSTPDPLLRNGRFVGRKGRKYRIPYRQRILMASCIKIACDQREQRAVFLSAPVRCEPPEISRTPRSLVPARSQSEPLTGRHRAPPQLRSPARDVSVCGYWARSRRAPP